MKLYPIKGWLLDAVVELDRHAPGVAGHVLRASRERRHVVAALLSVSPREAYDAELGLFVQRASHDDIVRLAFGHNPVGYRGAMARAGWHTQPRRFYRYLSILLTSPSRSRSARVVRQLRRVTHPRLQILRALPDDLHEPGLIDLICDVQQARDLTTLVALFAALGADRREMCRALLSADSPSAMRSFARRWAMRVKLPPHPMPASESYLPVSSGEELSGLARTYRNCARSYITRLLEGNSAMAEFRHSSDNCVIHLEMIEGRWWLEDIYGSDNRAVAPATVEAARRYLAGHGVEQRNLVRSISPWASLRRLGGHFDFDV